VPTARISRPSVHHQRSRLTVVARRVRWGVALGGGLILLALLFPPTFSELSLPQPSTHAALDILPVLPGGPAQAYAGYAPSTALTLRAHSRATITIRNFDLDATPLPIDSPYTHVEGTVGGVAYADGIPYSTLDRMRIAHTFTVPDLDLNVPIPSSSPQGKSYVVVTFSFFTGTPRSYLWQCHDPCGDGVDGLDGPMADEAYMRGTLTIED
jgi:hypothetical protein